MKTINKIINKALKYTPGAIALGLLTAYAVLKFPNETLTKVDLENGQTAIYLESTGTPKNSLIVNDENGFQKDFYTDIDGIGIDYTDPSGITRRITQNGYSTFNEKTQEYENFVKFGKDSTFYWKAKECGEIMGKIMDKKEKQKALEEQK